jgi:hypothetical protein
MDIEFSNTEDMGDDVLCRFFNEQRGLEITVITAPVETLGEDGPVVSRISDDQICVIFANEFVERKMEKSYENNVEELGEMARGIGMAYIMQQAVFAAEKLFSNE